LSSENPAENTAENPEGQPAASVAPASAEGEEVVDINVGCLREVAVEIPADVVSKEFDSAVQRYAKVARVPGFRKGKVPASIVRNRFAEEIRSDVLESLVPRYFHDAVIKEGYRPISEPQVHSLVTDPGKPVSFKAAFEIMPDIQLGSYHDIKVDLPEVKVTDEDVAGELKKLQERQASFDPIEEDRPLQEGDFAQIAFQAVGKETAPEAAKEEKPDNAEAIAAATENAPTNEPVKMDEVFVEIGGANTLPEFSQNLRGAKPGEERIFDVTYPADYGDNRLAGKTLSYTVKVNALKKKITPELTDDFAKELSPDLQTLDDLKKRMREGIFAERQHHVMHDAREGLLNQLTSSHDFPVPETMIQRQIDFRLEQWLRSLAAQGMRTEDMKRMDFKRLRASQRESAIKEVKAELLLQKIAEAENLQATDEEVSGEVRRLAQQAKEPPEALQQRLAEKGGIDRIRLRIRSDKALHFLLNQSGSNARNGIAQE
jgi:trigger factor